MNFHNCYGHRFKFKIHPETKSNVQRESNALSMLEYLKTQNIYLNLIHD